MSPSNTYHVIAINVTKATKSYFISRNFYGQPQAGECE